MNSSSEELQNENLNLCSALELAASNIAALQQMRSSESKWKELCDEAENMTKELEIAIPSQPVAEVDLNNAKTTRPQTTNKISSKLP